MSTAVGWAPLVKAEKQDDGTLIITGKAADSSLDRDHQIADPGWLDKALGQWYGEPDGGNVREQHDGKRAVGRAIEYRKATDGHYISAHIVDPVTVTKIENKVLRGFSWSARNARVQVDKAAAGGRIVDGQIYEVSVVDRPANPGCLFTIAKADGDTGDLVDVDQPELVVNVDKLDGADVQDATDGETLEKRDFTAAERDAAAGKGQAMKDGSFPIKTKQDLKNAISAYGRAKDKAAAKKHIIQRARALGAVDMLPEDWGVSKALGILDQVHTLVPGVDLTKTMDGAAGEDETGDAMDGQEAIAAIARLIISEAESLAEGNFNELWDIQILLDAACALRCFVGNEMREETMAEAAKTDDVTDDTTTADTDVVVDKTETESDTGLALSEVVTKAVTEATKPLKDQLDLVKAELAKVQATPIPGGPARVRTAGVTAVAAKADEIRRDITHLRTQVERTRDRTLRKGYQDRLTARENDLAKLDG